LSNEDILDSLNPMLELPSLPLVPQALSFSISLNFAIDIIVCPIMPFGHTSGYLLVNPFLNESSLFCLILPITPISIYKQ